MKKISLALVFILMATFCFANVGFADAAEETTITLGINDRSYYSFGETGLTDAAAYLVRSENTIHYIAFDLELEESASYKVTAKVRNSSDSASTNVVLNRKGANQAEDVEARGNVTLGEAYLAAGTNWSTVDFGEMTFNAGKTTLSIASRKTFVPIYFESLTLEKIGEYGDAPVMYCVNDRAASSATSNYAFGNLGIWDTEARAVQLGWNGYVTFNVNVDRPGTYNVTQFSHALTEQNYMYVYVDGTVKIQKAAVLPSNTVKGELAPYYVGKLTFEEAGTYEIKFYDNIGTGMLFSRFILEYDTPVNAGTIVSADVETTLKENATGNGYTTFSSGTTSSVNIYVPEACEYSVVISRAMGGNASVEVSVDDEVKLATTVPKTDTWSPGEEYTMGDITLTEGTHTLKFTTPSALMNVWYFKLAPKAKVLEFSALKDENTVAADGKEALRLSSGVTASYEIEVAEEGYYGITFNGRATAPKKSITVKANDSYEKTIMLGGTAFGEFSDFSGGWVYLNEGVNTLSFKNNYGSEIDIISISLSKPSFKVYKDYASKTEAVNLEEGSMTVEFVPCGVFEGEKTLVAAAVYEFDGKVKKLAGIGAVNEVADGITPIVATVSGITFEEGKTYTANAFAWEGMTGFSKSFNQ